MTAWTPPAFTGDPTVVQLTPMQAETLECLCRGLGTSEIAAQLLISLHTVKTHVRDVLRALAVSRRHRAVALVMSGQVRIDVRDSRHDIPTGDTT